MANCPKCGHKLRLTDLSQFCPACGVNMRFVNFEENFYREAKYAELAQAQVRVKFRRFKGAFIGSASGVTFAGDTYYSIVNPGVPAVGGSESTEGITAFDENMDTYRTYIEGHAEPTATPYDTTLTTRYNNKYPFKTVAELNPAAATYSIAGTHVGDWPAMETLVVNARTS